MASRPTCFSEDLLTTNYKSTFGLTDSHSSMITIWYNIYGHKATLNEYSFQSGCFENLAQKEGSYYHYSL